MAAAEPGLGARDIWHSEKSGVRYPTRWIVRIPAIDAELEVVPSPREQEFISQVPAMNKYEGASTMSGTWRGKPAKGFGYVELVGGVALADRLRPPRRAASARARAVASPPPAETTSAAHLPAGQDPGLPLPGRPPGPAPLRRATWSTRWGT